MKVIIHCGGIGSRLASFTKKNPKSMVNIGGKPLLLRQILQLKAFGVKNFCLTTHHLGNVITDYFGNGEKFGVSIIYSEEKTLMGTGGSLERVKSFFDDDTLVIFGDIVFDLDFNKLLAFHKTNKAIVTAVAHNATHASDSDLITQDNKFKLIKILGKPHNKIPDNPKNLSGIYVMSPEIINFLKLPAPYDIARHFLPYLLNNKAKVFCYNTEEFMMDIGTPERLLYVQKILKR